MLTKNQVITYGRNIGDPVADHVVAKWADNPKRFLFLSQLQSNSELRTGIKDDDDFNRLIDNIFTNETGNFFERKNADFFKLNQQLIMALLGIYSLPYCYAAAKGAEVLIHSKSILENPEKRLFETARFVLDVCSEKAFEENGIGYISIIKVRLLHAYIRFHASKYIRNEIPINQMDMSGTNLAFSLIVIRGLQKMGVEVSNEDSLAWIKHWNFIGSGLGIETGYLPSDMREAAWLDRVIKNDQFKSCEAGRLLTASLVNFFDSQQLTFGPAKPSQLVAALLGKEIASYLGLNYSNLESGILLNAVRFRNLMMEMGNQINNNQFDISPILKPGHGQFFQIPN